MAPASDGHSESATPLTVASPISGVNIEELLAQVRAQGTLRVIVQLSIPFTPEGNLSSAEIAQQRDAIARAQTDLLAGLSGYQVIIVSQSAYTPALVLVVDEAALKYLASSTLVAHIQADIPEPASP
jgi:hypothetical protein